VIFAPVATGFGDSVCVIDRSGSSTVTVAVALPLPGLEFTVSVITVPLVAVADAVTVIVNVVVLFAAYAVAPLLSEQFSVPAVSVQVQCVLAVPATA
jgi:hypothetical protein